MLVIHWFRDYKEDAISWITVLDTEFYPDALDVARVAYRRKVERFHHLAQTSDSSAGLLECIMEESASSRIQLLRIFRRYVSPDTSVEMLKIKSRTQEIIRGFGHRFRPIKEVRVKLQSRPLHDDVLMMLLHEYATRGQKGYDLTEQFFTWFEDRMGADYDIVGPRRAGRDVMLDEVLEGFLSRTPADFLISRKDGTPVVVGWARYDSDRGGAQEDDRTGGNRDKVSEIRSYAEMHGVPLHVLFVNDGPGLLLGSMWDDYGALEELGAGIVRVCTLKMLDERFTREWIEG